MAGLTGSSPSVCSEKPPNLLVAVLTSEQWLSSVPVDGKNELYVLL